MLKDKIIVVIGGAGLIGRSICKEISANGGTPIVADISEEAGSSVAREISRAVFFKLDITSEESLQDLVNNVSKKYKKIDAVVNSAYPKGSNYGKNFFEISYSDFCSSLSLHLGGYFLVSKVFSKFFLQQGYGNIINFSSIYGLIAPRFEIYNNTKMTTPIEYAAIKSGVIHITRYLAQYLKKHNIRVNSISPGGVKDQQPESFLTAYRGHCNSKGMLDPVDISRVILFLLSEDSAYITGQNLVVDDGFCL